MTAKIENFELKPFCVDTESLTEEQLGNLYDWCVEAQELYKVPIGNNEEKCLTDADYSLKGLDKDLEFYNSKDENCFLGNIIPFSKVRSHLGLPPLEHDSTEQLEGVETTTSETFTEAPVQPLNVCNLLSDTVDRISYTKAGIEVQHSISDDVFIVDTEEDLLMLCDLLTKVSSFKVV